MLSLKFNPEITFLKTNNYFLLLMLYSARIIEQIINNNPMKDAMSNGCFVVNTTLPVIPLFIKNAPLINAIIAKDTVADLDLNKFNIFSVFFMLFVCFLDLKIFILIKLQILMQ